MNKKFMLIVILILNSITIYGANARDLKEVIPYLQKANEDSFSKQQDVNNFEGCAVLIEQGKYKESGNTERGEWEQDGVHQVWLRGTSWLESRGISLDSSPKNKSYEILKSKNDRLVYVGKWQYIDKLGKNIRLISMQDINDFYNGAMRNYYESMDEQNKKIPEMPLKLFRPASGGELCIIKWHNKYGYNAIAETKKVYRGGVIGIIDRIFQYYAIVPTGRIIDAVTGEVIADEKGNLIK